MKFVEAVHRIDGGGNWGKFAVGVFTEDDWNVRSALPAARGQRLLQGRGWSVRHIMVFDLQTGEGALFYPGGYAASDLQRTKIWVCPLFVRFLEWLYLYVTDLNDDWFVKLPELVELPDSAVEYAAYWRRGVRVDAAA